jgi:septum formation protein
VILASASPRRRELLGALGISFEAVNPDVDELTTGDPAEVVVANAALKARAGREHARREEAVIVIGADTDVVIDGEILGKAADQQAARAMLTRLSGREHEVHGGLVVLGPGDRERSAHEVTRVRFADLRPAVLDGYLAAGAWRGFAGAYAIQGLGSMLVEAVEGDLANVIGLPVAELIRIAPELIG